MKERAQPVKQKCQNRLCNRCDSSLLPAQAGRHRRHFRAGAADDGAA
jgi:hypothetical protein